MRNAIARHVKTNVKDRVKQNTKGNYWPYCVRFDIQARDFEELKEKMSRMKKIAEERRE